MLTLSGCFSPKPATSEYIPSKNQNSIIGGELFSEGDALPKSLVAIYNVEVGDLCTGVLMPNNIVITAAHCIGTSTDKMSLYFETDLSETSKAYVVDKVIVSPYWEGRQYEATDIGDIALIHFLGDAPADSVPAKLIPDSLAVLEGEEIFVAGYGISDGLTGDGAGFLRKTKVFLSELDFAQSESLVDQTHGTGVCHGDSGGPGFVKIEGEFYLWGVASRGINDHDGNCLASAAFTNIRFYAVWINRMSARLNSSLVFKGFNRMPRSPQP